MPGARAVLPAAAVLLLLFGGWLFVPASTSFDGETPVVGGAELADQGRYLALAGNCETCHTAPGGEPFAGGVRFETPFGTLYSTNITQDEETGIGAWTFADFANSMRHGVRPDGTHLYPAFPYTSFTRIRDEDLAAMFAFLRTVPAVRQASPDNDLVFPFSIRRLVKAWKFLYLDTGPLDPDPNHDEAWNRGGYLVEALAHCGECHTPRGLLGGADDDRKFHGGRYTDRVPDGEYRTWFAPDLTGSETGLDLWTATDLVQYLAAGRNSFLETFGPMNEVIMQSTRHLDESDLQAMAVYLKSLPAAAPVAREPVPDRVMGRGRTIYNLHCGTCHLPTGLGDPDMAPKLNRGSLVVQASDPASMINVILYAPEGPDLPPKWRVPMDEFRYELDDEEIAAVASFVRNSWDNRAGLVTPAEVARQR